MTASLKEAMKETLLYSDGDDHLIIGRPTNRPICRCYFKAMGRKEVIQ